MPSDQLLRRVKKVRISDTVVDQIVVLIEEGKLKLGDQLPSERELVIQLDVGRASVREALRILEAQGVIEVKPGKGIYITGDVTRLSGVEGITRWFREHADEIGDIIELREALERHAAFLAATRATDGVIAEMRAALEEAEHCVAVGDLDKLGFVDQRFHRLLGQACGNDLIGKLVDEAIEAMTSPRRTILRVPHRAPRSIEEHRVILDAICSGDSHAAEQAVVDHIESVRKAIASLKDGR